MLVFFVGASLVCAEDAPFQMPKEFSVDMEITQPNAPKVSSKMFVSDQKSRMESAMGGQQMVMITRLDKKVAYHLMPAQKSYMEMQMPSEAPKQFGPPPDAKWEKKGSEKINGVNCEKYEASFQSQGAPQPVKVMHWVRKDNQTLVRVSNMGSTTDWKNLKEGKQDPSLFEVPSGYKKVEMPAMQMPPSQ